MGYFSITLPIFCPSHCGTNLCHSQDGWCCVGTIQSHCNNDKSRWEKLTNEEDQELVRCTSYEVFGNLLIQKVINVLRNRNIKRTSI